MSFGDLELCGHFDIISLGVNRNGLGTSSIVNYKFNRALGQLHDPWCKQPLRSRMLAHERGHQRIYVYHSSKLLTTLMHT